jgi:iron complex transport system substrate-binding protein
MAVKRLKKLYFLTAVIVALAACAPPPDTATRGGELRLVSTSAAICEIADAVGLDLAGVPETSGGLPERYADTPRVGPPMTPDFERIKALKPTAVLTPTVLQYDLKPKYDGAGIPSVFVDLSSVSGLLQSVRELGERYGGEERAREVLARHELFMEEYNAAIAGRERPRVLILIGLPDAYMAAGEGSYIGSLVKLAGGENVYADRAGGFSVIGPEEMLTTAPDIILRAAHGLPDEARAFFQKEFAENDVWKHFGAVQRGRVYDLDYTLFNMTANLRYTDSRLYLRELLYGDAA